MTEFKVRAEDFPPQQSLPCWLYHSEHGAAIFNTEAEYATALAQGWRDSPAALEGYRMPHALDIRGVRSHEGASGETQKVTKKRKNAGGVNNY